MPLQIISKSGNIISAKTDTDTETTNDQIVQPDYSQAKYIPWERNCWVSDGDYYVYGLLCPFNNGNRINVRLFLEDQQVATALQNNFSDDVSLIIKPGQKLTFTKNTSIANQIQYAPYSDLNISGTGATLIGTPDYTKATTMVFSSNSWVAPDNGYVFGTLTSATGLSSISLDGTVIAEDSQGTDGAPLSIFVTAGQTITITGSQSNENPLKFTTLKTQENTLSNFTYTNPNPMPEDVGGAVAGTTFDKMELTDLLDLLLYKDSYPKFTAPSVDSYISETVIEVGLNTDILFKITANRGKINPANGTSGFRAGIPTQYYFDLTESDGLKDRLIPEITSANMSEEQLIGDIRFISPENIWFTGSINYTEGEQPLSLAGKPYSTPYEGGIVEDDRILIVATLPYFATSESITDYKKFVEHITADIVIDFAGEDLVNKQKAEIPEMFEIKKIQVTNPVTGAWTDTSYSSFTQEKFIKNINGIDFPYIRYTHNSIQVGARPVRFVL